MVSMCCGGRHSQVLVHNDAWHLLCAPEIDRRLCEWAPAECAAVNPDVSSGLMAGAERQLVPFIAVILASGYDNGPAAGPGSRGSTGPGGSPSWIAGTVLAGQGACGSASMRCHAAVIASAHGQVAWIFRRRFRPPRTRRAAACSTR